MAEISSAVENSLETIAKALSGVSGDSKSMVKSLSIIAQGIGSIKTKDYGKSVADIEKSAEKVTRTRNQTVSKLEELYAREKDSVEKTTESVTVFGVLTKDAGKRMVGFGKSLTQVDGSFSSLTRSLSNLPAIGPLFAGLGFAASALDETVNAFRAVSQSGIQFENGIAGLMQARGEFGISMQQTGEMLKKYSSVVQRVGTTAFTGFINEVRTSSDRLYAMGFSYQDMIDSSSQFLETQRNLTGLRSLNEQEQKIMFDRTVTEFYKAAQITGVGVQEMMNSLNEMSKDASRRILLQQLPEGGRTMMLALEKIDPNMFEIVMDGIKKGALFQVDAYNEAIGTPIHDMAPQILRLAMSNNTDAIANVRDIYHSQADRLTEAVGVLSVQQREMALQANAAALAAANTFNDKIPTGDPPDIGETDKALLQAGPQLQNAIAGIKQLMIEGVVDLLGPGSTFGEDIANGLTAVMNLLTDKNNIEALKLFMNTGYTVASTGLSVIDVFSGPIKDLMGVDSALGSVLVDGMVAFVGYALVKQLLFRFLGKGKTRLLATAAIGAVAGGSYAYNMLFGSEDTPEQLDDELMEEPTINPDMPIDFDTDINIPSIDDINDAIPDPTSQTLIDENKLAEDVGKSVNDTTIAESINRNIDEILDINSGPVSASSTPSAPESTPNQSIQTTTVDSPSVGQTFNNDTPVAATPVTTPRTTATPTTPQSTVSDYKSNVVDDITPPPPPTGQIKNNEALLDFEKKSVEESEESLVLVRRLTASAIQMAEKMNDFNKTMKSSII